MQIDSPTAACRGTAVSTSASPGEPNQCSANASFLVVASYRLIQPTAALALTVPAVCWTVYSSSAPTHNQLCSSLSFASRPAGRSTTPLTDVLSRYLPVLNAASFTYSACSCTAAPSALQPTCWAHCSTTSLTDVRSRSLPVPHAPSSAWSACSCTAARSALQLTCWQQPQEALSSSAAAG